MSVSVSCVLQFSNRFRREYARSFAPLLERTGLTMREMDVLLFLTNNPGRDTARDVVELRGLPKSQVSQAVEVLAERGVLRRSPDGADRRVIRLSVTEAGAPLAREAQGLQADCWRRQIAPLTEPERQTLCALLEKVLAHRPAEGESLE